MPQMKQSQRGVYIGKSQTQRLERQAGWNIADHTRIGDFYDDYFIPVY